MSGVFIILLVIAVILLWNRVTTLEQRQEKLEKTFKAQKRGTAEELPARATTATTPTPAWPAPATPAPDHSSAASAPAAAFEPTVAAEVVLPRPAATSPDFRPAGGTASRPASVPPVPPEPMLHERIGELIRDYFTGGNLVVRVGVIVLFFGVAFLLKYAAEHTQLSIQMRLIGVAIGATGLFVLGWVLRHRRRGFALALQGGAIGVAYLTLFAALRLYALLSPEMTFALMAALGVMSCLLAVRQDAQAMAVLGATGGFLAPVLASTGQGNHVVLFSYYALLDVFIVAQAWFKTWRPLNLVAFVFTFGVGTTWGVLRYDASLFASTEPFLLFFFAAFVAIAVLFAFRTAPRLGHYVDGTLVFGTPVVAMTLQMALVRDFVHGRAASALVAGLVYLLLAAWLHYSRRDTLQLLKESFLALGVAFLTLAVPLWLDDTWTATTWALEGAALVWIGLRQGRVLPTTAGMLLQLIAAAAYVLRGDVVSAQLPVANADFMGALFISVAGLTSARVAMRPDSILKSLRQVPSHLLLAWGLGWWLFAAGHDVDRFVSWRWDAGAYVGLCAGTALLAALVARLLIWPGLRVAALLLLPVMLVAAWLWAVLGLHPGSEGGVIAWPFAFAALWLGLLWHEKSIPQQLAALMHGIAWWLLALLPSWELCWQAGQIPEAGAWTTAVWGIVPTLMLVLLTSRVVDNWWPLRNHTEAFRRWVSAGLALYLLCWSLWANVTSDGAAAPLAYLPLLNPLDLIVGLGLLAAVRWLVVVRRADSTLFDAYSQSAMITALVLTVFVFLNAVLLRTIHHWMGVPYRVEDLAASTTVQASLSIFWTLLALGAMLWANRTGLRAVWFGGAGLMAVVVGKLFLVDLVRVGTLPRIVSFLVVGGLMLVIGYFSPLPPSSKTKTA